MGLTIDLGQGITGLRRKEITLTGSKFKPRKFNSEKVDLEAVITAKIIAALETGTRPWARPWTGSDLDGMPVNLNGVPYRGINALILWLEQSVNDYTSRYWFTMKGANGLGAKIKKGSKGTHCVKWTRFELKDKKTREPILNEDGKPKTAMSIRAFVVFNADQCEGLPEKYTTVVVPDMSAGARLKRIEHAESYFNAIGAVVKHGGNRAFFSPTTDFIQMPEFRAFKTAEFYYATLGHEHVHWSGHAKRLDRKFGDKLVDTEAYAKEELVAEIGAAILCAGLGIESDLRDDHAAYVASWLKALKNDKKLILVAASKAQKAVDYLTKFSEPVSAADATDEAVAEDVKAAA